jgi:PAS domain S-box-containing protein
MTEERNHKDPVAHATLPCRPDGGLRALRQRLHALEDEISGLRRDEQALRRSEARLRDFVESASISLHWVGPDGTVLWANQAELDLLGYTREEYIGHNIAEFHADPPVINDILQRLTCGQKLHDYPARLRAKDGSIRHVLITSSVLFEESKFIHTRCFTRDISAQKRAEDALRESEARLRLNQERLRLTQHVAQIAPWEYKLDTDEFEWSPEAKTMLQQPLGQTYADFLSLMRYSADLESAARALKLATKKKAYATRFRIARPDGEARVISARGVLFFNNGQNVLIGAFIDVTETEGSTS